MILKTVFIDYAFIVNLGTNSRTCTIPAEFMQLEPGYCYSFIFKLTQSDASPTKSPITDNPVLELMYVNRTPF